MKLKKNNIVAVIPAAGIGKRMLLNFPKQYLVINKRTIIEHSISTLLKDSRIIKIIIVLHKKDNYFCNLPIYLNKRIFVTRGGINRCSSVFLGLSFVKNAEWVLIHDAVRPCLQYKDLNKIIDLVNTSSVGGILTNKIKDTIKFIKYNKYISHTVNRDSLFLSLTPQIFPFKLIFNCLKYILRKGIKITDESSALELCGYYPKMVLGSNQNIKLTFPEDLKLINYYLNSVYI
ncbi:2-C-methyl-D-erythritol 4-phosphate cytidylyltransferase [Buchnera aphidicola (Neophyllaphis podocarpi)]|uniref:2-C-methyl-D-erythritol 4-phosphate cytidylyltransferase n=1 Tax=Buchnera aphidicola TaxID=9 RepID=UPI0031B8713A